MSAAPQENHEIEIPIRTTRFEGKELRYRTPNSLTEWRVDSLFLEEPDTVRWLSCMREDDVLIDIGANVGMYSTLAAIGRGVRVYAFEPESQNYSLLNQNIYLNDVSDKVTAYCAALSDTSGLSMLYLGQMDAGGAFHASGEALDFNLEPLRAPFAQGCVLATLDQLVGDGTIPVPTHIKLDVDGFEYKVVNGMLKTISNPTVKSVAIELNPNLPEHREIFEQMAAQGFRYFDNQWAESCPEDGPFKDIGNVIFYRPSWPEYETLYQQQIGPMRVEKSIRKVASKIAEVTVLTDPAPHFVIEDVFPSEFSQNLLTNLSTITPFQAAKNSVKDDTVQILELNKHTLNTLPGSEMPFWNQLIHEIDSTEFIRGLIHKFAEWLPNVNEKQLKATTSIVREQEKMRLSSSKQSLVSLCFSLDSSNKLLGFVSHSTQTINTAKHENYDEVLNGDILMVNVEIKPAETE